MSQKTYYQVLQVDPQASSEVIEAAYHRLARSYHPDLNKLPDALRRMQLINDAYSVLRDPIKRHDYDSKLQTASQVSGKMASNYTTRQEPIPFELPPRAKLAYQRKVNGFVYISIGEASDFHGTLNALKAKIPATQREFNSTTKQWKIPETYEYVFRELFSNYATEDEPLFAVYQTVQASTYSPARPYKYSRSSANNSSVGWFVGLAVIIAIFIGIRNNATTPPPALSRAPSVVYLSTLTSTPIPVPTSTPLPELPTSIPELSTPIEIATVPQGCPTRGCTQFPTWCAIVIKGNISYNTGERIYHVPGGGFYNSTSINSGQGERWFCSEAEAQAAGWRRSKR